MEESKITIGCTLKLPRLKNIGSGACNVKSYVHALIYLIIKHIIIMKIENIEGLDSYGIGLSKLHDDRRHYSCATLIYGGLKVELEREYYATLELAVKGLKDRLKDAVKKLSFLEQNDTKDVT